MNLFTIEKYCLLGILYSGNETAFKEGFLSQVFSLKGDFLIEKTWREQSWRQALRGS